MKTAKKLSDKIMARQIKAKLGKARKLEGKIKKLSREKNKLVDAAAKLVHRREKAKRPKLSRHALPKGFSGPIFHGGG